MKQHSYRESVVNFGPSREMVGILTEPEILKNKALALIIVNAGVLHRVGACRVSVDIARSLAGQGVQVFRFDYSGLGDSVFASDAADYQEQCQLEVVAAMNALEQNYGVTHFVVHGLCSGSIDAFNAALADERVVAISQIDTFAYKTPGYYRRKVLEKFASVPEFFAFLRRRVNDLFATKVEEQPLQDISTMDWSEYPAREKVEEGYRHLVERGVRFLIIYTGSWDDFYNSADQIHETFPAVQFGNLLDLHYLPETEHLMNDTASRELLIARLEKLLSSVC